MKFNLFAIVFFLSSLVGYSQNTKIDSLELALSKAKSDTSKANLLIQIASEIKGSDMERMKKNADLALSLSEKSGYKKGIAGAKHLIGHLAYQHGNFKEAKKYYDESLAIFKELKDDYMQAKIVYNLGIIAVYTGDYKTALKNFFDVLSIHEKRKDERDVSDVTIAISNVYGRMGNLDMQMEYLIKAEKSKISLNDQYGLASVYMSMGNVNAMRRERERALEYYQKSLEISLVLDNKKWLINVYGNIGMVNAEMGNFKEGIEYSIKSLELAEEVGDKTSLCAGYDNLGSVYYQAGQKGKSKEYYEKALALAKEIGEKNVMKSAYKNLTEYYIEVGQYKTAVEYMQRFVEIKDSLLNEETTSQLSELQTKYETEKKELEIEKLNHEKAFQNENLARKEEEIKRQNLQKIAFAGGFGLMIVLALVIYRGLKQKQKANSIITLQKEEVERQRKAAEHQKELVEEKNKEIIQSINYAKRLQDAILPPLKLVKENLPESFVLYKPKDIVAGDFYWMETFPKSNTGSDIILFAAADCTGHGVPGAMVSVVCSNALNRVVKEFHIYEPGKILDKVTDLVIETFEKSEAEVKDGMDISLVSIANRKESESGERKTLLRWAGANNPLWVVRKAGEKGLRVNNKQLIHNEKNESFLLYEIKADKQPIGKYAERRPFTNNEVEIFEGDSIYIFTDGYADQFGGDKGKKFKSSKMKELILSIQNESMNKQKNFINDAFENWRGTHEQIDDVCLIGVRL